MEAVGACREDPGASVSSECLVDSEESCTMSGNCRWQTYGICAGSEQCNGPATPEMCAARASELGTDCTWQGQADCVPNCPVMTGEATCNDFPGCTWFHCAMKDCKSVGVAQLNGGQCPGTTGPEVPSYRCDSRTQAKGCSFNEVCCAASRGRLFTILYGCPPPSPPWHGPRCPGPPNHPASTSQRGSRPCPVQENGACEAAPWRQVQPPLGQDCAANCSTLLETCKEDDSCRNIWTVVSDPPPGCNASCHDEAKVEATSEGLSRWEAFESCATHHCGNSSNATDITAGVSATVAPTSPTGDRCSFVPAEHPSNPCSDPACDQQQVGNLTFPCCQSVAAFCSGPGAGQTDCVVLLASCATTHRPACTFDDLFASTSPCGEPECAGQSPLSASTTSPCQKKVEAFCASSPSDSGCRPCSFRRSVDDLQPYADLVSCVTKCFAEHSCQSGGCCDGLAQAQCGEQPACSFEARCTSPDVVDDYCTHKSEAGCEGAETPDGAKCIWEHGSIAYGSEGRCLRDTSLLDEVCGKHQTDSECEQAKCAWHAPACRDMTADAKERLCTEGTCAKETEKCTPHDAVCNARWQCVAAKTRAEACKDGACVPACVEAGVPFLVQSVCDDANCMAELDKENYSADCVDSIYEHCALWPDDPACEVVPGCPFRDHWSVHSPCRADACAAEGATCCELKTVWCQSHDDPGCNQETFRSCYSDDACVVNRCLNGGACLTSATSGYTCDCVANFTGAHCEIAPPTTTTTTTVSPCAKNECSAYSTGCTVVGKSYACGPCKPGFTGDGKRCISNEVAATNSLQCYCKADFPHVKTACGQADQLACPSGSGSVTRQCAGHLQWEPAVSTCAGTNKDALLGGIATTASPDDPKNACTRNPCSPNSRGCELADGTELGRTCLPCRTGFRGDGSVCVSAWIQDMAGEEVSRARICIPAYVLACYPLR